MHLVLRCRQPLILHAEAEGEHTLLQLNHFFKLALAHRDFKHFLEGYLGGIPEDFKAVLWE